jgi:glycosyltransferase involved in cell wall biosynthesis
MSETYRISVIIPTYNRKGILEAAIQSVAAQSLPAHEIIVVDDGSTDGTSRPSEFDEGPARLRYFRLPSNRGGSFARNFGIDHAEGEYIAFLDSDDIWLPGKLQRQSHQLRPPASKFLLCSNATVLEPAKRTRPYNPFPPVDGENVAEYFLMRGCSFQTSTLVLPTALARRIRFDESLRRHQDWDFVLRCIFDGAEYVYDHEPLVIYRADNPEDAYRLARSTRPEPTLEWFARSSLLPSRAKAYHYAARYFLGHLKSSPLVAARTFASLTFTDQAAFFAVLGGLRHRISKAATE